MVGRRRALTVAALALVAVAGVVGVAWTVWPGLMSSDSFDQLRQARLQSYNPWHPPLMAWTWHWADLVVRGPAAMMIFQCIVLYGSLATLSLLAIRRSRWGWLSLLIGFVPPVFILAGHLWKDVLMAVALVAAVALLAVARDLERPRAIWWGLGLLFYATGIRHNANTATLPLVLWAVWRIARHLRPELTRRRAIALGFGAWVAMGVGNDLVSLVLCDGRTVPPTQTNFLHDLVGISKETGEELLPRSFLDAYRRAGEARLRSLYRPDSSDPITYKPGEVAPVHDRRIVSDLRRAWLRAVARHPLVWAKNRWELFRRVLQIGPERVWYAYHPWPNLNDYGVTWHFSRLRFHLFWWMDHGGSDSLVYRGWAYMLFAVAVIAWAVRTRRADGLFVAVAASVFLYLLPLAVFAPATDFRYIYWPILGALILPWIARQRPNGFETARLARSTS